MKEDDGTAERLADKAADAERSIIKNLKRPYGDLLQKRSMRMK